MANPTVSVIVPIFNVEAHLSRCVESLLAQTHHEFQVILVNDGSTDSSGDICESLAHQYEQVSVVHKPNGGLADARNAGLKKATGEFVCFIDSDDWVEPKMLEAMLKPMANVQVDVVLAGMIVDYVDDSGALISSTRRTPPNLVISDGSLVGQSVDDELINLLGYAWNKLYRTEFLRNQQLTFTKGLRLIEDIDFNSRAITQAREVAVLDEAFVHYIQRPAESLGTVFLPDFLSLRNSAILATQQILNHWGVPQKVVQQQVISMGINALRMATTRITSQEQQPERQPHLLIEARKDGASLKETLAQLDLGMRQRLLLFGFFCSPSWLWLGSWKTLMSARDRLPAWRKRTIRWRMKLHSLKARHQPQHLIPASSNPRAFIFLAADYGNLGDLAITEAQRRFLEAELPEHEVIEVPISETLSGLRSLRKQVKPDDLITLIGGGNTGDMYDDIEYLRELVIKAFPANPMISFPQTIEFSDSPYGTWAKKRAQRVFSHHRRLFLIARDSRSAQLATSLFSSTPVFEAPDIVLSLPHQPDQSQLRTGFVIALREDKERHPYSPSREQVITTLSPMGRVVSTDTHLGDVRLDERSRHQALTSIWEEFARAEVVVTDRLHGMIFSVITGTPCVVMNSSTGKVHQFMRDWFLNDPQDDDTDTAIQQAIIEWDPEGHVPLAECVESLRGKQYIYNPTKNLRLLQAAFHGALKTR